jgi:hypothetical protein
MKNILKDRIMETGIVYRTDLISVFYNTKTHPEEVNDADEGSGDDKAAQEDEELSKVHCWVEIQLARLELSTLQNFWK